MNRLNQYISRSSFAIMYPSFFNIRFIKTRFVKTESIDVQKNNKKNRYTSKERRCFEKIIKPIESIRLKLFLTKKKHTYQKENNLL